jgi:opacity protein-like surface antigen
MSPNKIITVSALALTAVVTFSALFASVAHAQSDKNGSIRGYEFVGPYAQLGVSVGQIDFDGPGVDNNASGGFNLTGGYRIFPWLSAEANFTYLGGGSVEDRFGDIGDGSFFAFTFGPKFYPLGALEVESIPDTIQPYGLIQIGGGQFDIENTNYPRSGFVARFIIGLDFWATDHFGVFVEGGGHATDQDDVDGVGIFTFGGQYRF